MSFFGREYFGYPAFSLRQSIDCLGQSLEIVRWSFGHLGLFVETYDQPRVLGAQLVPQKLDCSLLLEAQETAYRVTGVNDDRDSKREISLRLEIGNVRG